MKNEVSRSLLVDALPWHLYWFDKMGILLGCNQAVADFFGFANAHAAVGQDIYKMISNQGTKASDLEKLREDNMRVYAGESIVIEEVVVNKGEENIFTSYKYPLKNEEGEIIGIVGTSLNITEQKKRENKLLEENKNQSLYLKNILNAKLPVNFYWMNRDGVILGCNEQTAHAFGLSSSKELIGKSALDFHDLFGWSHEMCIGLREHDKAVMKTRKPIVSEEFVQLNGESRIYLSHKNPLIDDAGKVVGVFGFSVDITKSKEMEFSLAAAAQAAKKASNNVAMINNAKKNTKKLYTLLVENSLLAGKVAQTLLMQEGHAVVIAQTINEALEQSNQQTFDLILIAINDGIDLAKAIRHNPKNPNVNTSLVGLMTYPDPSIKNAFLNAGIQEVFNKPLSLEKIRSIVIKTKPAIDSSVVTQTFGGNAGLAKEILGLLIQELPKFKEDMNDAFQKQDWEALKHHVHKLHGGLCYTDAVRLREVTRNFEKKLIANVGHNEEDYQILLKEIDQTIAAYNGHY